MKKFIKSVLVLYFYGFFLEAIAASNQPAPPPGQETAPSSGQQPQEQPKGCGCGTKKT